MPGQELQFLATFSAKEAKSTTDEALQKKKNFLMERCKRALEGIRGSILNQARAGKYSTSFYPTNGLFFAWSDIKMIVSGKLSEEGEFIIKTLHEEGYRTHIDAEGFDIEWSDYTGIR